MKKRIKIVIIIFVILMILLAGTALCIYFFTESFKSEKQLFMEYLSKSIELVDCLKDEDLINYRKKQQDTPYTNNGEIKVNFKPVSGELGSAELVAAQNCNIKIQGSKDAKNKYFYQNVKANYSDEENLDLEYFNEQDLYGLKINNILKKYLTIENNNLKEWAQQLNLEEIADIPNKIELETQNLFQEEQINNLKEKYLNIITDNLNDDMFSKEETSGKKIYTLKTNENQIKEIIIKLLNTAKDDEMIINALKSNKVNADQSTNNQNEETITNLKMQIQNIIDTLSNSENLNSTEPEEIKINIYVESGKVNKLEINVGEEKLSILKNLEKNETIDAGIEQKNPEGLELTMEENETKTIDFKIEKSKKEDDLTYELNLILNNIEGINFGAELSIDFRGIKTLDTVQELCVLNCGSEISRLYQLSEDVEINAQYSNLKQFTNDIPKEQVKEEDIMLLNGRSMEKIQSLFKQMQSMLEKINEGQMKKLDVSVNPMIFYIPATIPTSIMIACNLPSAVINTGTISNVLPIIFLGNYIYNSSLDIITDYNEQENQEEQQQNQEAQNQENQGEENQNQTQENLSSEQQISETEKQYLMQTFNKKYEQYKDKELTFENLNTLMKLIKNNNQNNSNHYINVESNIGEQIANDEYQFSEEDGNASISIEYDEEGYISKIIIQKI